MLLFRLAPFLPLKFRSHTTQHSTVCCGVGCEVPSHDSQGVDDSLPDILHQIEAHRSSKRIRISYNQRLRVWKHLFKGSMKGYCCSCRKDLEIDGLEETQKGGRETSVWHCSHVKPVAHGGSNDLKNLTVLCRSCNSAMGNMHLVEYCRDRKTSGYYQLDAFVRFKQFLYLTKLSQAKVIIEEMFKNKKLKRRLYCRFKKAFNPRVVPLDFRLELADQIFLFFGPEKKEREEK